MYVLQPRFTGDTEVTLDLGILANVDATEFVGDVLVVTDVPVTCHMGPFATRDECEQLRQRVANRHTETYTDEFLPYHLAITTEELKMPAAYGTSGFFVQVTYSRQEQQSLYGSTLKTIHRFCRQFNSPLHITDGDVRDAWIRQTGHFALPGWLRCSPDSVKHRRFAWPEFYDLLQKYGERANYEIHSLPRQLRVAFIDLCSFDYTTEADVRLHIVTMGNPKQPLERAPALCNASGAADVYIYLHDPRALASLDKQSLGRVRVERGHHVVLEALARAPFSMPKTGVHLIYASRDGARRVSKQKAFREWLDVGFMKARLSGVALPVALDPLFKRVKQLSGNYCSRLMSRAGHSVFPTENSKAGGGGFKGGLNRHLDPLLLRERPWVNLDIKSCYPSTLLELGIDPTNERQAEWFREADHLNPQPLVDRLTANAATTSTEKSTFRSEFIQLQQVYFKTRHTAFKLYLNGLYGLFGYGGCRWCCVVVSAAIAWANRAYIQEVANAALMIMPPGAAVCMLVHDSVGLLLPVNMSHAQFTSDWRPKIDGWMARRFMFIRLGYDYFTGLLVAATNMWAAMKTNNEEVHVRGLLSQKAECPPTFAAAFRHLLVGCLTSAAAAAGLTNLLQQCQLTREPPAKHDRGCVVFLKAKKARELRVRIDSDKEVTRPVHAYVHTYTNNVYQAIDYTYACTPAKQQKPMHATAKIDLRTWTNFYLERYLRQPLHTTFKAVWTSAEIDQALATVFGLDNRDSAAKTNTVVDDYWKRAEELAAGTSSVLKIDWRYDISCANCRKTTNIASYDDSSQQGWRKSSRGGLLSVCPQCQQPLQQSGGGGSGGGENSNNSFKYWAADDYADEDDPWNKERAEWLATCDALEALCASNMQTIVLKSNNSQDGDGNGDPIAQMKRAMLDCIERQKYIKQ